MTIKLTEFQNILLPRFDGIGDLVLFSGLLRELRKVAPKAEITLLLRSGLEDMAPMLADNIKVLTIAFNPYKVGPESGPHHELLLELQKRGYDLLLLSTYNRTWLDESIATTLSPAAVTVVAFDNEADTGNSNTNKQQNKEPQQSGARTLSATLVKVERELPETEKYRIFRQQFSPDKQNQPLPPRLEPTSQSCSRARELLDELELGENFLICAPAGIQNVLIKAWAAENFIDLIETLPLDKISILLVAHHSEKQIIEKIVELATSKNLHLKYWLGDDHELPLMVAIASFATLYLGNDTGLMHICSALGVPVATLFGGGTWPRFLPSGPGIAFFNPLPCFDCNWDCYFQQAPCLQSIKPQNISADIKALLRATLDDKTALQQYTPCRQQSVTYEPNHLLQLFIDGARLRIATDQNMLTQERNKLSSWESDLQSLRSNLKDWQEALQKKDEAVTQWDQEVSKKNESLQLWDQKLHQFQEQTEQQFNELHHLRQNSIIKLWLYLYRMYKNSKLSS